MNSSQPTRSPSGLRACLAWGFVALLILVQACLLRQYAVREVVWFPPCHHDQAVYLGHSFRVYDAMLAQGFFGGLRYGLRMPIATGLLQHVQAPLLYLLFGPSRLAALALVFLYFAVFQVVLVATLYWMSGRWSVALYGLGLLLTANAPHFWAGGLTDFRIDFIAACLFGVLLCVVLRSGSFSSPRWSLAAGAAAAFLVLFRYLTVVYLAGILGTWELLMAVRCGLARHDPEGRRRLARQLRGGLLAGLTAATLTLPVLYRKRQFLWDYYVANHLLGSDKEVRAAQVGVTTPAQSLFYYGKNLVESHAGPLFLILAAAGAAAAVAWRLGRGRAARDGRAPAGDWFSEWSFLGCSLLVPYAILTANVSKSPVVGNILVPPLLWLALLPVVRLAGGRGRWTLLPPVLAGIAVACGLAVQFSAACRCGLWTIHRPDAEQILALQDEIVRRTRDMAPRTALLSTDCVTDVLALPAICALAYEKDGVQLKLEQLLGSNHLDVAEAEARAEVERSDLVILSGESTLFDPRLPFHGRMRQMRGWLRDYCARELSLVGRYPVLDVTFELYARPTLQLSGVACDWITSKGFTLTGTREDLARRPAVCLSGKIDLRYLGKVPHVQVVLKGEKGDRPVPATLEVENGRYRIRFTVDPADLPRTSPVTLAVHFDAHFVPKALGLNEDPRELVVQTPQRVILTRPQ